MAYKPVRYVIFDLDGLLLNTEDIFNLIFPKILKRYGKTYDPKIRMKTMGMIPKDSYSTFVKDYNIPTSPDEFYKEVMKELLPALECSELMPGAERLVDHLKNNNVPMALATSSGKDTFEVKAARHSSLFRNFHHVVVGSVDPEVKHGKPAPDIFLVCASRFPEKPSPSECLVFEDAPNGVQAAVSAGMQVIMVPESFVPPEQRLLATKVLNSLMEFKPEEFGLPKF